VEFSFAKWNLLFQLTTEIMKKAGLYSGSFRAILSKRLLFMIINFIYRCIGALAQIYILVMP